MYLYFDKKGVLLEIVNDEALRQYNHQVNTMYVYIENVPTTELPQGLLKLQYWFERPNGETTAVYDTLSHPGDVVVTETVPFDIKRDVRKFSYGTRYKMFKIEMPSGRIIGQDESGNPVYEYNIFEDDGPVSLTIKAIFVEGAKELTLGKVVFTIEKEVVIPTNSVSVSQYEYILRAIDALTFTVGKVTTETLNPKSEAAVTVTQDKSSTELKNYPIDFEFGIPKGATFIPAVAENGDISWTNDGGLENPQTVNIKGATGATPNIVANATVDENVGVPEVNVTKTGTNENPNFAFTFKNLKGETGETPNITATVSVNSTVGTPSAEVVRTGTNENPNLAFTFKNLKGETGETPNIVANATVDENVGVPEVNVTKTGTNENPTLTFNFRNLRGKDAEIPSELTDHLTDYSNPHKTTAEQVGAVPVDFRSFSVAPTTTKNFRQSAELFVGNNGNGLRMTLQDVKNMGTKIVTVNDIKEADFDNLDVGDYIYSKI